MTEPVTALPTRDPRWDCDESPHFHQCPICDEMVEEDYPDSVHYRNQWFHRGCFGA